MLNWCVNAYPNRIDWCKKQYDGFIATPSSSTSSTPLASPVQTMGQNSVKSPSAFDALLPRISSRPSNRISIYRVGPNGHFAAQASDIAGGLKSSLLYADILFDDDDPSCNLQDATKESSSYLDCTIYEKDAGFNVSISQPSGGKTSNKAELSYQIEGYKGKATNIFVFSIVADAISRMLDPDLSDDQRADVFEKLGENYYSSGRIEGVSVGMQAKYTLTEDDGNLNLVVTPTGSDSQRKFSPRSINPVLALATSLDRPDLIKPDPLDAPEIKAEIVKRRELARTLLAELDGFRYNRHFHSVGFMENQPYNQWIDRLGALQRFENDNIRMACIRSGAGKAGLSLYDMAYEYMHNSGRDTSDSIRSRAELMEFLSKKE